MTRYTLCLSLLILGMVTHVTWVRHSSHQMETLPAPLTTNVPEAGGSTLPPPTVVQRVEVQRVATLPRIKKTVVSRTRTHQSPRRSHYTFPSRHPSSPQVETVQRITGWSTALSEHFIAECQRYALDPALALAVAKVESTYRQTARNHSCYGIYQINTNTAPGIYQMLRHDGRVVTGTIHTASMNVTCGVRYLTYLKSVMPSEAGALVAYNRGIGGANRCTRSWGTDRYVKKVQAARVHLSSVMVSQ
jgi:hypothetical protein